MAWNDHHPTACTGGPCGLSPRGACTIRTCICDTGRHNQGQTKLTYVGPSDALGGMFILEAQDTLRS
ncbi:MAG: hypothetical protein VXU42_02900 [Verrucomicrobiota bacterium]|nr:hypothetical protein [Verrucomicrobiota bacterium]